MRYTLAILLDLISKKLLLAYNYMIKQTLMLGGYLNGSTRKSKTQLIAHNQIELSSQQEHDLQEISLAILINISLLHIV